MTAITPIIPPGYRHLGAYVTVAPGDRIWLPSQVWRDADSRDYGEQAQWYGCVVRPCGVVVEGKVAA